MSQPRILITGGTGFAGSHLVEYLLEQGFSDTHVTSLPPQNPDEAQPAWLIPANQIHFVNLTESQAVAELIKNLQPTQIYHLAALSEVGSSFKIADKIIINNTLIQLHLLEAVRQFTPQARLLIVGSAQEYDIHKPIPEDGISENHPLGPANPYAVSKVTQDLLALSYHYSYKLDIVVARPFNHIGERQAPVFAIPSFAQQIVAVERGTQSEIKIGNLDAVRDFTDVKDVASAYALLMTKGISGETYNIGSGHGVSMKEILDRLLDLSTMAIKITTDPEKIRPHDAPVIVANSQKIQALGWKPQLPLETTLQRVIEYWRHS